MIQVHSAVKSPISPGDLTSKWMQAKWFALYTRSRHEKLVHRELGKKGIESFLPVRQVVRNWSDRKKIIEDPLFKGYLFVRAHLSHRFSILNTAGVVCFIANHGNPIEVPEAELLTIRKFVEEKIPVDPFPYLKEGQEVYVRSGPLKGAEGFIVRKDSHCRLVVSLNLLQQSISVQIDEACVEPK